MVFRSQEQLLYLFIEDNYLHVNYDYTTLIYRDSLYSVRDFLCQYRKSLILSTVFLKGSYHLLYIKISKTCLTPSKTTSTKSLTWSRTDGWTDDRKNERTDAHNRKHIADKWPGHTKLLLKGKIVIWQKWK